MEDDSIAGSQHRSLRIKRRILKEKQPKNDSVVKDLLVSDEDKEEDSVYILSQKESTQRKSKGGGLHWRRNRVKDLLPPSQENISELAENDSPTAAAPSRRKKLLLKRRGNPKGNKSSNSLNISLENPPTPKSVTRSTKDLEENISFHPNVESTRILNLTTPGGASTPRLRTPRASVLNLSQKSLYNQKLTTQQVTEGGTQMSPLKETEQEEEEEPNLSAKSLYTLKLTNRQVMEGGTQTSPYVRMDVTIPPEVAVQNEDDVEEVEGVEGSQYSDSSVRSGFIPYLCQTRAEKVIVPFSEGDFDLGDEDNSFTSNNKDQSDLQDLVDKDGNNGSQGNVSLHHNSNSNMSSQKFWAGSFQNGGSPTNGVVMDHPINYDPPQQSVVLEPNVSRLSNLEMCEPNTSMNKTSHENNADAPSQSPGFQRPFFDSSESESEDVESNHLHCGEENNNQMKSLTPCTFGRRYGSKRNPSETLELNEEGSSKRKNPRKSIFVKNSRAGKINNSESIVSFKDGFEYFSRFCPFELSKKAKEEFFKISEEILTDIINRVSDEAFYDCGRTTVCLKDVKNVMIQYKCFPPTPKEARYTNQHLYAFLIKNCDPQAAKHLIPLSSFDLKKDKYSVDIWDNVDEEMPTAYRKRLRPRKK